MVRPNPVGSTLNRCSYGPEQREAGIGSTGVSLTISPDNAGEFGRSVMKRPVSPGLFCCAGTNFFGGATPVRMFTWCEEFGSVGSEWVRIRYDAVAQPLQTVDIDCSAGHLERWVGIDSAVAALLTVLQPLLLGAVDLKGVDPNAVKRS